MAQSRKEAAVDRKARELYKEFMKGAEDALDSLKREPKTTTELQAQIKEEDEALVKMQAIPSFTISGDFGGTLERMSGHISALIMVSEHTARMEKFVKDEKKEIKRQEVEKAKKKAEKDSAGMNAQPEAQTAS